MSNLPMLSLARVPVLRCDGPGPVRLRLAFVFCLAFACIAVPPVFAEGTAEPDSSATPSKADQESAPKAIPVNEIGVAAERTKRRVAETRSALKPREDIAAVEEALPVREAEVAAMLTTSEELRGRAASLVEIDQLRQEWRAAFDSFGQMQATLDRRAGKISVMREDLANDLSIWEATAQAAEEVDEDAEVRVAIDKSRAEIVGVLDEAKSLQGELSTLQGRVAALSGRAQTDVAALNEVRRNLVGRVFERDRIPMFSPGFYELLESDEIVVRLIEHREREVGALSRFLRLHRERLTLHGIATIVLIVFVFTARVRIRRLSDDSEDEAEALALAHMRSVFDHPIALAFLLSLFVGIWGYEEIPPLAAPMVGATALLPAVLILRGLVQPPVRPVLYVVLALYFVDRLNETIAPLPGLPRLVFIGEMLIVMVLVLWWRRPSRLLDVPRQALDRGVFRWLRLGLLGALFAAPLAIVAELAGYTALARMLGGTTLAAGYAGIMLYGSALAVDGLVAFLLRAEPLCLSGMVQRHRELIAEYLQRWTRWLVTALFVWVLLSRLEIVDFVYDSVIAFWTFGLPLIAVTITFGSIIEFLIVVRLTFLLSRFIQFTLEEEVYTRVRMPKGQPYAVSTLTHYTVLMVGFTLAVFALGLDVNRFTMLAGAFGVGIGFGLQTIVSNFVSGIILLTEQPVQVGDTIELEGVFGEVQRIGIRSSTVRTWQGAEVIVPNAQLISEQVTNWTLSDDRRRIEIPIGVAYGTDPKLVIELLERVARGHANILADPSPGALFMNFGDSALEFELRCWTDMTSKYMAIRSDIIVEVETALRDADIKIPFPQRDLHLTTVAPGVANVLAGGGATPTPEMPPSGRSRTTRAAPLLPDSSVGRSAGDSSSDDE